MIYSHPSLSSACQLYLYGISLLTISMEDIFYCFELRLLNTVLYKSMKLKFSKRSAAKFVSRSDSYRNDPEANFASGSGGNIPRCLQRTEINSIKPFGIIFSNQEPNV